MEDNYRIVPDKSGWRIQGPSILKMYDTKDKAVAFGRLLSSKNNIPLIIHKKDGRVQSVTGTFRTRNLKTANTLNRRLDPKTVRHVIAEVDYEFRKSSSVKL